MLSGLYDIFAGLPDNSRNVVLQCIIKDLEEVREMFLHQNQLMFRGSSVLIAFEADKEALASSICNIECDQSRTLQVKLIDFVHVWETNESDSNYIEGITSLMQYLKTLTQLFIKSFKCT